MDLIVLIVTMALIGAFIGGMTNLLAIRMLFRPHQAKYIGKWKIPFTPGLIPKRQKELAGQLGKLVSKHLITTPSIQSKLKDSTYPDALNRFFIRKWDELENSDQSVADLIEKTGLNLTSDSIESTLRDKTTLKLIDLYESYRHDTVGDIISPEIDRSVDQHIPSIRNGLLKNIHQFLRSAEGGEQVSMIAGKFLEGRGFLGRMISQYVGERRISEKLMPSIIAVLESKETEQAIDRLLQKEWSRLKSMEIQTIREKYFSDIKEADLSRKIIEFIQLEKQLERPLSSILSPFSEEVREKWIPLMTQTALDKLANRLPRLMEYLNLAGLVENEVNRFEVSQLENMLVDITKRELKMITFLGALLGGLIGIVQALLVTWIG